MQQAASRWWEGQQSLEQCISYQILSGCVCSCSFAAYACVLWPFANRQSWSAGDGTTPLYEPWSEAMQISQPVYEDFLAMHGIGADGCRERF